jgi:hypothetical protein
VGNGDAARSASTIIDQKNFASESAEVDCGRQPCRSSADDDRLPCGHFHANYPRYAASSGFLGLEFVFSIALLSVLAAAAHFARNSSTSSCVKLSIPMNLFEAVLALINSSSFAWISAPSRFCVFWIRKTIRKVTMVVLVLYTPPRIGEMEDGTGDSQARTMTQQMMNAAALLPHGKRRSISG